MLLLGVAALFLSLVELTVAQPFAYQVWVGYADNLRPSPYFPRPYINVATGALDPGVSYFASSNRYGVDSGAVRIHNVDSCPLRLERLSVALNPTRGASIFELWAMPVNIPAGTSAIFIQTADYNFDSSDYVLVPNDPSDNCSNGPNWINTPHCMLNAPQITVVAHGQVNVQFDTAHVVNTGGYDTACCAIDPATGRVDGNECLQWRLIGTTGLADRGGTQSTPAPTAAPPTRPPAQGCVTPAPTAPTPPTHLPTRSPTGSPTFVPSAKPTARPTTVTPTFTPTRVTAFPTTQTPTSSPTTLTPTAEPTPQPTTKQPTPFPTTDSPTVFGATTGPTEPQPTFSPTTPHPTSSPVTLKPTTLAPTALTTRQPTFAPTTQSPTPVPAPTQPLLTSLTITAGSPGYFTINSRDRFGNPTGDASSCVSVATGNCVFSFHVDDSAPLQYAPAAVFGVSYKGSSHFQVQVTPYVAGVWNMSVDLPGARDVFQSPYTVYVLPAALNATLSTLRGLSHEWEDDVPVRARRLVAGRDLEASVHARDAYNNKWRNGLGNIRATVTFCPPPNQDCAGITTGSVETTVQSVGGGVYDISLSGQFLTVAGVYLMQLRGLGQAFVPSGDSVYFTVMPDVTSSTSTTTTFLNDTVVHSTAYIYLRSFDRYLNPTYFPDDVMAVTFVVGEVTCIVTQSVRDGAGSVVGGGPYVDSDAFISEISRVNNTNQWAIAITPLSVGTFTVNVTINTLPLSCLTEHNLGFRVVPGPGSPPHSLIAGPLTAVAGERVQYRVDIRDQWDNPIMQGSPNGTFDVAFGAQCQAPLGASAPCPASGVDTWLNVAENGPAYAGTGYPDCVLNGAGRCPAVLVDAAAPLIADIQNSTYFVTVKPVKAGVYPVVATFKGGFVNGSDVASLSPTRSLTVLPAPAALYVSPAANNVLQTTAGMPSWFDLTATDIYGNVVNNNEHAFALYFQQVGTAYTFSLSASSVAPFTAPQSLGNGVYRVHYTLEWAGNYTVLIGLIKADGSPGTSGSLTIEVLHQTCGFSASGGLSATPYRCPSQSAGVLGTCVAAYSQCSPAVKTCSDPAQPVLCSLDGPSPVCAASAASCPCPNGYSRCASGNCAASCPPVPQCPAGAPVPCSDGSCRTDGAFCPSTVVCPPGTHVCFDGVTCADDVNTLCPAFPPAACPAGQFACASGACVSMLSDCPSKTTCPDNKVVCGSDNSCRSSAAECPQLFNCYEPTTHRCPDGSCRSRVEDCPSQMTCAPGYLLCANGHCAADLASCSAAIECGLNLVRCPNGMCANNTLLCPTSRSCPAALPVLCDDGSCADEVSSCPTPRSCPDSGFQCPDGSCVKYARGQEASAQALCPTLTTCPPTFPVLCSYGACVAHESECKAENYIPCPAKLPVRCPDNSCSSHADNCASQIVCPLNTPVMCQDGTCKLAQTQCTLPPALQCPDLVCPDGTCTTSLLLCPSTVTCPAGSVRCVDGTCRLNDPTIPTSICPSTAALSVCPILPGDGPVPCPQFVSGTTCAFNISECARGVQCPALAPVMCIDRTCAATVAACPPVPPSYPESKVPCWDGSWAFAANQCPSPIVCPNGFPYKCWDQSCRKSPSDCPVQYTGYCAAIDNSAPYLCPSGVCDNNFCTATASPGQCIDPELPYACATGQCVKKPYCNASFVGDTTTECCDASNYQLPTSGCMKAGYVQCANGMCVAKASYCPQLACPADLPYLCPDGMCAFNVSTCNLPNGCPYNQPFRCNNGACADGIDENQNDCPIGSGASLCPGSYHCKSGACATSADQCPEGTGMCDVAYSGCQCRGTGTPQIHCLDGTCSEPGNNLCLSTALFPPPAINSNRCPPERPFRCDDGYCAASSVLCVGTDPLAAPCPTTAFLGGPTNRPFRCASGHCVLSGIQCPIIGSCDSSCSYEDDRDGRCVRRVRCQDGTCKAWPWMRDMSPCPIANTCPNLATNPSVQLTRCSLSGLCVADPNNCIGDNGCPLQGNTYLCPSGACAVNAAACTPRPINGCSSATPFKCTDGSCVANSTSCLNSLGCPLSAPYKCTLGDGSCQANPSLCASGGCPPGQTRCADGTCVSGLSECHATNNCPIATPIRCVDGTCKKFAAGTGQPLAESCAPGLQCTAGFELCANGVCQPAGSGQCPPVIPCPGNMFTCPTGACAATQADCAAKGCPNDAPVLCGNGQCVLDTSLCPGTTVSSNNGLGNSCPANRPVLCNDGSCFATYEQCQTWITRQNEAASGEACGTGQTMCSDGSCVVDPFMCRVIPACPRQSIRCPDGSCVRASQGDTAASLCVNNRPLATCSGGKQLCEDGVCRSECLHYNGCGLDKPYHCLNRECTAIADESVGGACHTARFGVQTGYSRRLLDTATENAANTAFATWSLGANPTTFKNGLLQFTALPASERWRFAGELTAYTGHVCGYGLQASTCSCDNNNPPRCANNATGTACQPSVDQCYADVQALKLTFAVNTTASLSITAASANGVAVASLIIPSASLPLSSLVIRPAARSRMVNAQHVVDRTRAGPKWGFGTFMSFTETLLSPAFECLSTNPAVREPFPVNITYSAQIDLQRFPDYRDVCLGYIDTEPSRTGRTFATWACVNQGSGQRLKRPLITISNLDGSGMVTATSVRTSPLGLATATFGKCGRGIIYGFIHSPTYYETAMPSEDSTYKWVTDNIVYLFIGLAVIGALLTCSIYLCSRLYRNRVKYHESRMEVDRVTEEVAEMQQYGGRAGRKDQEIVLTENPMIAQMHDLERAIDNNEMERQRTAIEEAEADSEARAQQRRALAADTAALEFELEKLRAAVRQEEVIAGTARYTPTVVDEETEHTSGVLHALNNAGPPLTVSAHKAFDKKWVSSNQREIAEVDAAKMRANRRRNKRAQHTADEEEGEVPPDDDDEY